MSIAGDILQAAVGSALKSSGGGEWLDMAMEMVGNEGQAALVESIGSDFDSVWDQGVENGGDFSEVNDLSSHPEAISDILAEIEGAMDDKYAASQEDAVEDSLLGGILGMIDAIFE